MRLSPTVSEALIVVAVLVASGWWGARYTTASLAAGRQPAFYQQYFEPAVMMACGHGFVATVPDMASDVRAFLQLKTERLSCEQIPADVVVSKNALYQSAWIYLIGAVGVTWTLFGISWSALSPLFGLLFGISVASVYLIARFGMGRTLSLLVAAAIAVSTLHLLNLPHLRDYSKAPFVLASVVVVFAIVTQPPSWRTTPLFAALYGVILGIGYGFRTDLLAGVPVILIALGLFLPGGALRLLPLKAASAAAFAVAFLLCAWPVLNWVAAKGGCQWHVILLGLAPTFDAELGVTTAAVQWGPTYSDSYLYATISAYADRSSPAIGPLEFCTPEYDRVSSRYLRDVVVNAPGDFLARAYSSVLRITELPFPWYGDPIDGYVPWLYMPRGGFLHAVSGFGFVPVVVTLAVLGASSLRLGFFALFFIGYFGGYPALQFSNRHYFHLEFVTWWAAGFVIQMIVLAWLVRGRRGWGEYRARVRTWATRLMVFATVGALLVVLPLMLARWHQERRATNLISSLLALPVEPLELVPSGDGLFALPAAPTTHEAPDLREFQYLRFELDPVGCGEALVTVRYAEERSDLYRDIATQIDGRPVRHVLVPAYWHFRGIGLTGGGPSCVKSAGRVNLPGDVTLLPTLALPDDWRTLDLYQKIRR